jgi:hypothetical protein
MKKLLVVVLILAGMVAWADTFGTGQWLHDGWQAQQKSLNGQTMTPEDHVNALMYMGFVLGASHVMVTAGWIYPSVGTVGQDLAVVGKYLENHPEQWNEFAEVLVYRALYAVWPGKTAAPYR